MHSDHADDITEVRPRPDAAGHTPYHIVNVGRGHAVAVTGNYLVHVTSGASDMSGVQAMVRASEQLCNEHAQFGFLSKWTDHRTMLMSKEQRAAIDAMVARFSPRYGAAAIVFGGEGFAATAARSLVTSVNLSTSATHPNRVFNDLEAALVWLREKFPGGTADAPSLRATLGRLESELFNAERKAAAGAQR